MRPLNRLHEKAGIDVIIPKFLRQFSKLQTTFTNSQSLFLWLYLLNLLPIKPLASPQEQAQSCAPHSGAASSSSKRLRHQPGASSVLDASSKSRAQDQSAKHAIDHFSPQTTNQDLKPKDGSIPPLLLQRPKPSPKPQRRLHHQYQKHTMTSFPLLSPKVLPQQDRSTSTFAP